MTHLTEKTIDYKVLYKQKCKEVKELQKELELLKNPIIITDKQRIIDLFNKNIKGKKICLESKHFGSEGHWLEKQMGVKHNMKNEPDIYGYEMKKLSKKITLGDFSASEYAYSKQRTGINKYNKWTNDGQSMTRTEYIHYFGTPNPEKNNRYSWSGSCVPKYNKWNTCGQNITINDDNDIIIKYSYSIDERDSKHDFPEFLKKDNLVITLWRSSKMKRHINDKFNQKGFFICKKIEDTYQKICFGNPFNFEYFIECFKNKKIIFDSGMYEGNNRNYSQFRGTSLWNELIIEEY